MKSHTALIDAFLIDQRISDIFEMVFSNKGIVQNDRIVVKRYHYFDSLRPHVCPLCPPNMYKDQILQEVLCAFEFDRIVYVVDGGSSYFPATRMRHSDIILERKEFLLVQRISATLINAKLREWESDMDVLKIFKDIF